jgi:hypothetical protein
MKIKTNELTGAALDWTVAKCEGAPGYLLDKPWRASELLEHYSTDWAQGGPIIERERIATTPLTATVGDDKGKKEWFANYEHAGDRGRYLDGDTPLIAAMRCYVASKLGGEVEIPAELLP